MRGLPVQFADFSGGINVDANVYSLAPNECQYAQNVVSIARGGLRKRNGNSLYVTSPVASTPFGGLIEAPGVGVLGAAGTGGFYRLTLGSSAAITGSTPTTAGTYWEFVRATASGGQGPFFAVNGTDTPKYVNAALTSAGSWVATSGTVPNGKYMRFFQNRIFIAGTTAKPSRLYWSGLSDTGPDPLSWPAENYVDFDPDDGEAISGFGTIGPYLIVFKPSKAWIVVDTNTGANRPLGAGVGCVSHRSIVESPEGTFFLSKDQGVMRTDGSRAVRVSDNIKPLLDQIPTARRSLCAGIYFDRHYYLSATSATGTSSDLVFDLDDRIGAWFMHTHSVGQWLTIGGKLAASRDSGVELDLCYVTNRTQDTTGGTASNFTAEWRGPVLSFGSTYVRKRVRRIHFEGAGMAEVLLSKDFDTAYSGLGGVTFPASETGSFGVSNGTTFGQSGGLYGSFKAISESVLYTPGVGRTFSLSFRNTSSTTMEVDSYTFSISGRRD